MKDGESLSIALGSNSELPHCCRESCDFTLTEREELPRDVVPQEFVHLNGPDFFRVNGLFVVHERAFWNVGGDFLRFRQRSDPLAIIKFCLFSRT